MDASSLINGAQDAYALGLQKQATAGAAALKATGRRPLSKGEANQEKVHAAAQQFEAFFVGQMMEHMMAGIDPDPMFGGGTGEETWRSMLNQEYGKEIAKTGKLGIADNVMKAMLRAQEERTAASAPQAPASPQIDTAQVTGAQNAAAAAALIPVRR